MPDRALPRRIKAWEGIIADTYLLRVGWLRALWYAGRPLYNGAAAGAKPAADSETMNVDAAAKARAALTGRMPR